MMKIMNRFLRRLLFAVVLLSAAAASALPSGGDGKDWRVVVSVADQKTYVYRNSELVRAMVCSTGIQDGDNDTPLGDYILNESGAKRGEFFFSEKVGEGGLWWVGFIGGVYLFHSVPVTRDKEIIPEEAALLGMPASHGCVRLGMADARWFYETVPDGAAVHIQLAPNS
ncbi:MAG: L,D-transpeptidase [Treponemataceae bacterium]|nr:L,D-transpeptidase [Treponemataceae bacterium]